MPFISDSQIQFRGDGIAVLDVLERTDVCLANSLASRMFPDELLRGTSTGSPAPPVIALPNIQRVRITDYWGRNVRACPHGGVSAERRGARIQAFIEK